MVAKARPDSLVVSRLQAAWLQELGVSRQFVKAFMPDPTPVATPPVPVASAEAQTVVSGPASVPPPQASGRSSSGPEGLRAASQLLKQGLAVPRHPAGKAAEPALHQASPAAAQALPDSLDALAARVADCTACTLHKERHKVVVGQGAQANVALMVIGEAPGPADERAGLPFQGKAGDLLQAMLAAAGLSDPQQVYYTHLLKCRPASNRVPEPDEIAACLTHLRHQISLLQPQRLLVLGRVAAQALLGDVPVDDLRGRAHDYPLSDGHRIPAVVSYHPAALLSRPRHKAGAWQDLCLLKLAPSQG